MFAWCIRNESGAVVDAVNGEVVLPHASVGKVLLLTEVARQLIAGECLASEVLSRPGVVKDSGLWQHLGAQFLTVQDACVLVGSVSDNLATNALIERVGLTAVQRMRENYLAHLPSLALLDVVRDERSSIHPPELSRGSVNDWSLFMFELWHGNVISQAVSSLVCTWLALSVDHSLVLAPLNLDPFVSDMHRCLNKTGCDSHVRADAGVIHVNQRVWSFSACVSPVPDADLAVNELRGIGTRIKDLSAENSR